MSDSYTETVYFASFTADQPRSVAVMVGLLPTLDAARTACNVHSIGQSGPLILPEEWTGPLTGPGGALFYTTAVEGGRYELTEWHRTSVSYSVSPSGPADLRPTFAEPVSDAEPPTGAAEGTEAGT